MNKSMQQTHYAANNTVVDKGGDKDIPHVDEDGPLRKEIELQNQVSNNQVEIADVNNFERCDLTWKNLTYTIDVEQTDPVTKEKKIIKRTILNDINGYAKAGECLAIMGSSGAGKTSLLNILASKVRTGGNRKVTGDILYNGKSLSGQEVNDCVGFVMQSDIFLSFLTPEETFKFAADLRYNKTEEQKNRLVDQIIKDMKLENARNTIVGNQMVKGISGGEKKRVNIGFELISDPQIQFLDEPTSGLDSYTAMIIINLLKKLATRDNKTIIYTIHQPNSDIFKMFDILMLMMHGKIVYHGSPQNSIKTFNSMGGHFKVPPGANPVDHYMHLMQKKVDDIDEYTQVFSNFYDKQSRNQIENTIEHLNNLGAKSTINKKLFAGQCRQWTTLFKRAITVIKRDPTVTIMRQVQVFFNCFIVLSVWWQISDDVNQAVGSYNRAGVLFFLCSFNFIPGMFATLSNFPIEREVLQKEYTGRFYGIVPYYITKTIAEIPFAFFFPALLVAIVYWGINMNNDFVRFIEMMCCCGLIGFAGQSTGILLGCMFSDFRVASLVAPAIFYPMMLFSGYYVSSDSLAPWISWVEYISLWRYGLEWLMRIEFTDTKWVPNPIDTFGMSFGKSYAILGVCMFITVVRILAMIIQKMNAVQQE